MAITINGDVTGSEYSDDIEKVLNRINVHYSGDDTPMVGTDSTLEAGRIWHDTANDLLRVRNKANDDWVALPFNTETGTIVAGAGVGITGLSTSNFANPDFDLTGAKEGNTTIASAMAVKVYVDALDTSTETDRALIRTEFAAADTAHNIAADAHGVSGGVVGTTGAQTLTDKTLTSPEINGGTIDEATIGVTTPNSGKFTTLESTGAATLASAGVSGDLTVGGNTVLTGNLTVNGTETIINSTIQSHADKDIILAAGATTNAGVTGAGLLLGSPTTLESWLYDGVNWEASAPVKAESFKVGDVTVIGTDGKVDLEQFATGALPSGIKIGKSNWNNTFDSSERIGIPQGGTGLGPLQLNPGDVLVRGAGLGVEEFKTVSLSDAGSMLVGVGDANSTVVARSGATLRTTIGVGIDDTPLLTGVSVGSADTTITKASAGNINIGSNIVYRAGGATIPVADGGTGKVTVTAGVLLRGDNANDLAETTIGTGLGINANSLDVDLSELDIQSFNQVPSFASNGRGVVVVNTAENALEYSTSVVDNSAIESWARTSGGAGTTAVTNRVLTHSGTDATTGYAWVDANDSDALNVGLGVTESISVASVSTTGDISASGNLSVSGNTTLGDDATDTIAINGLVSSGITPDGIDTRDFGSDTARWKSVHTNNLSLGGQSVTEIDTDISGIAPTVNTSVPSVQAVRTYVDSIEAGGSIVILAQPNTKNVPAGGIAIVTISGITKMFTASTSQTGVSKGTDFDGSGIGTNFEATTNWTEFTAVGGTQVTINKFTGDGTEINFMLSLDPGSEDNVNVFIDGVYQLKDAYIVSGDILSFGTGNPVPNGSKVEVLIGTSVNFASGSIGDVTATGTIIAPNIGNASTSYLGDGSNLSNLPDSYSGWTVSDGANTSLTSSGETLTLNAGGGTSVTVSDNALSISSPSLGTGNTQAALGDHTHEASLSVTAGICTGGTGGTNRSACEDGGGLWAPATLNIGAGGTTASVSIETLLANITIDDLG